MSKIMNLKLSGIAKSYGIQEARVVALHGVDLEVEQGDFLCIWGASGSGKSTLLNILGLLDVPDSGRYHLSGMDVSSLSERQRTKLRSEKIWFIFQGFNLVPVLSALETSRR